MDIIKLSDINPIILEKEKIQGTQNVVYEYGDKCIKILCGLYSEEKNLLYKKLMDMDGLNVDGVIMPIDLIMHDDKLYGYTMKKFKNSINLYDYFTSCRYVNSSDILKTMKKASLILRNIHNNGIIYQDLSFDNILIDENGNIKFCDIDGCRYKDYPSPFTSDILKRLINDYREDVLVPSENTDRISMMISMLYLIYSKEIQELSQKEYQSLSEHIKTLNSLQKYVYNLTNKNIQISNIPYLDQLICDNDDYIIDRNKQIGLKQKILNIFNN